MIEYDQTEDKYICILGCLIAYASKNRTSHTTATRRLGHKKKAGGACYSRVFLRLFGCI